eukprot:scaffold430_cov187-Alexandrium_tamarense.AAC.4
MLAMNVRESEQAATTKAATPRKKRGLRISWSKLALACIGAAILVVIGNTWHLAVHHVHHDLRGGSKAFAPTRQYSSSHTIDVITSYASSTSDAYILSPICGACYRSKSNEGSHCSDYISGRQKKELNSSFVDLAPIIGKEVKGCEICNPEYCREYYHTTTSAEHKPNSNHKRYQSKYWRFDQSAPKFINPTTLTLQSIPSKKRIPPSRFNDSSSYFQDMYNSTTTPELGLDFLLEYNPGLVVIPPKTKQYLPKEAAYLVSLRVTPANNCFASQKYSDLPQSVWKAVYKVTTNHLGLALLDENYQMLHDVVIDLDAHAGVQRPTTPKMKEKYGSPTFMDYRLFSLNGEIYLHVNFDLLSVGLTKLKLRAKGFKGDDSLDTETTPPDGESGNSEIKLDNLYGGDLLEVSLMHQFNTIWSGGKIGKNYALFTVPNKTHPEAPDSVYAEIDINPKHRVQQFLPDEYDNITLHQVFEHIWKPGTKKTRALELDEVIGRRSAKEIGTITESNDISPPSFSTVDALSYPGDKAPFKERGHGGACCVSLSLDDVNVGGTQHVKNDLLVGIAHTKVTWKPWYNKAHIPQADKDLLPHTHYVSYFYAFDPQPPFQVRARSGYFCLGFAPKSSVDGELPPSEGGVFNPHSVLTRNRMLQQNNITFNCPQMHFVSSFTEKAGDSSGSVIGYGLNDCTPRIVEVEKQEIVRLLFPDPMDMLFEEV